MSTSIPTSTLEKFTTFGDLLRFLRRRIGITQMELSIAVGYSDTQISRLEQNLRLPDIPTIEARFISALSLENEPKAVARLLDLAANVRREDAPALGLCPYKGLNYFDETDTDLFVGREALTVKLTNSLLNLTLNRSSSPRFLAVVGASGSGKSSLVRAGLVPALRWNKKSSDWLIHVLTPTAHPLESLATSIMPKASSLAETAALIDDLQRDPRSLHIFARREVKAGNGSCLLLVVDQFEELFALCRSEEEGAAFISNLLTAASEADGPIILVITLRADFYAYCSSYPKLREALAQHQEYMGAMDRNELRRAVEEPAQRGRWELEPGLVDLLLHDVGNEPGGLPLLSHALLETWQRRRGRMMTMSGYASSGGVRGAIAETAEAIFTDQFTQEQQIIARRVFLRLTELGDETATGDTRRRATFNELILKPEEAATTQAVLKALADARLITTSEDSAEVAHEALIREWPTLRGWLEDNREGLRLHRHLTEAAQEWQAANREPDMVYRGARLAQVCEWAKSHQEELNALEREFLNAAVELNEREAAEREAQQKRELEAAQKLAETEKHGATRLRIRNRIITGVGIFALMWAILAGAFALRSKAESARADKAAIVSFSRELAVQSKLNLNVDTERSVLLALSAYNTARTKEAVDALHEAVLSSRVLMTLNAGTGVINDVAFSPDGKRFASASDDHTVKIWETATGKELFNLTSHTDAVIAVWFSPDGRQLASGSADGSVKLWEVSTGKLRLTINVGVPVSNVQFGPDGQWIATGAAENKVRFWDTGSGQELFELTDPDWNTSSRALVVTTVSLSRDGKRLAIALHTQDDLFGRIELWDVTNRQRDLILSEGTSTFDSSRRMSFSPDGKRIVTEFWANSANPAVWDTTTGKQLYHLNVVVNTITYSSDGRHLFTATGGGKAQIWDAESGQLLQTLWGHDTIVASVDGNSDCMEDTSVQWCGTRLVSGGVDGTIKVWDITPDGRGEGTILSGADFTIDQDWSHLTTLTTNINSLNVLTATFQRWIATGKEENRFSTSSAFSSDWPADQVFYPYVITSGYWLTFSPDGTIHILDTTSSSKTPTSICCFDATDNNLPQYPIISPNGRLLAFGDKDNTVKLWDVESRQQFKTLNVTDSGQRIKVMAFSPDSKRLAVGFTNGGPVKVWDIATGKFLLTLTGQSGQPSLTFSPDGKLIAAGDCDTGVFVWDAITGEKKFELHGHSACVTGLAFSLDNSLLASASNDHTTRIWDLKTGQELLTLPTGGGGAGWPRLAFNPDNRFLLASVAYDNGDNYDTRIFLLNPDDLVTLAKSRLTRSLTTEECQKYLHMDTCPALP